MREDKELPWLRTSRLSRFVRIFSPLGENQLISSESPSTKKEQRKMIELN